MALTKKESIDNKFYTSNLKNGTAVKGKTCDFYWYKDLKPRPFGVIYNRKTKKVTQEDSFAKLKSAMIKD
jgi:hypothetical protein